LRETLLKADSLTQNKTWREGALHQAVKFKLKVCSHTNIGIVVLLDIRFMGKSLIRWMWLLIMEIVRVYLMKANKTFEGTADDICTQIGKQINSDLMGISKEKIQEPADK
jgi:hypothetical protein